MTQEVEKESNEHETKKSLGQRFRAWLGRLRDNALDWWHDNYFPIVIVLLSVLLLVLYLAPSIFISVPAGHTGVKWLRFWGGTVLDKNFPEGVRVKAPWDLLEIYDLRLQLVENEFDVLASDGLAMKVEISTRFRLLEPYVPALHKNVGPNYINKMLVPEIGAHAREQIARYRPEQIYTSERLNIQNAILETVEQELRVKYLPEYPQESFLHVEDVFIRSITLPAPVEHAIKEKLVQRHVALSYEYRLERERMERKRKAIEARGIQDFQTIVSQGISERYLQWKGIDATLELARSNNSKIVIIGAGEDGLPIILGGFDTPTSSAALPPGLPTDPTGSGLASQLSGGTPLDALPSAGASTGTDPQRIAGVPLDPQPQGPPGLNTLPPNAASDLKMTFSESGGVTISPSTSPSSTFSETGTSAATPSTGTPSESATPGSTSPVTPPPTR